MENKVSIYDCASMFAETMNNKYPEGDNGSALLLVTSDGDRLSCYIGGDDDLIRKMIAQITVEDKELRGLIGDGLIAGVRHSIENGDELGIHR